MAVDVFEAIGFAIRGWHQFDHPHIRMAGHARGFVEERPAAEIGLDLGGEVDHHLLNADGMHQPHHIGDGQERHKSLF